MQQIVLEDFLNDMAVIRTTFEAKDLFPPDDSIALELDEMIEESRQNLIRGYEAICEMVRTNPAALPFSFREFQIEMIRGITKGWDKQSLNNFMKTNAFDEGESSLYYFEAAGLVDIETAREMPAQEFVLLIFNEILHQAKKLDNYANGQVFDREVFQRYHFILFVSYCVMGGPLFYSLKPR